MTKRERRGELAGARHDCRQKKMQQLLNQQKRNLGFHEEACCV